MDVKPRFKILERLPRISLRSGDKTINQISLVRFLLVVFFLLIVGTILTGGLTGFPDIFNRGQNEFTSPDKSIRPVNWNIALPEDYSIRDDGTFYNEYYSIFYEPWSGNYRVYIYQGREYDLRSIKFYINSQLLTFKDFEDFDYFEKNKVIFEDKRSENIPTMEIPEEPND